MRRLATVVALAVALPALAGACAGRDRPGAAPTATDQRGADAGLASYHLQPQQQLDALRAALGDAVNGWEYSHGPLADEFDAGVRQVELDVFVDDPQGDLPKLVPVTGVDPPDPSMSDPGSGVPHPGVDFRSCPTFVECLTQVKAWSDAHPGHLPITIQVEPKDDPIPTPAWASSSRLDDRRTAALGARSPRCSRPTGSSRRPR